MDKQKSEDQSFIETTLMPPPDEYLPEEEIADTRKLQNPEESLSKEKEARVNAEWNEMVARSAVERYSKDAQRYKQRLEIYRALVRKLRHEGKCREIGFATLAEEMGKIEADVGALVFWHGYVGEVSKDYSALIEKNQKLDLRNGTLAGENDRLTAQKEDLQSRLEAAEKLIDSLGIENRAQLFVAMAASGNAEQKENIVRFYEERFGSREELYDLMQLEIEKLDKPYNGGIKAIIDAKKEVPPTYARRAGRLIGSMISKVAGLLYKKE